MVAWYFAFMIYPQDMTALIRKYDVPVPRYTSYPTMPYWDTGNFNTDNWVDSVKRVFVETNDSKGISLYIHLPFCESLCTYCACNTRITKNHSVEIHYIRTLLKEWGMYIKMFSAAPVIRELHLGGGTPTFFSAQNLKWLISEILDDTKVHPDAEFSFEGHPNNTTEEHLRTLYQLGFTRVSFGVQDLNEKVQRTINRIQPFENLDRVARLSRDIGYESINFDLIYGLPFQTPSTIFNTVERILTLKPERIAFYSYAHVPWIKPGQRGYEDADLPSDVTKRQLYETGRAMLKAEGYEDVGMDHFALPHDSLFKAQRNGKLHRNFMGYTTTDTDLLVGLGASAISDAKYAYAQNLKKVEDYAESVANSGLAILKGHLQSKDDVLIKKYILEIACQGKITQECLLDLATEEITETLAEMTLEGILTYELHGFRITEQGRTFIRIVCSVFDERMRRAKSEKEATAIFSKAI